MQRIYLHGIISGVLAAIAGVIYLNIYENALGVSFNKIVNTGSIFGACIFGCVLMSVAYMLLDRFNKQRLSGVINIVIAVLSFASIISPISMSLPLDIKSPELFPGLVIPMHFFPALAFFCIAPFFKDKAQSR